MIIKIISTRDSVCAADDVDSPHETIEEYDEKLGKEEILKRIIHKKINIQYKEQLWTCFWNSVKVADISMSGTTITYYDYKITETVMVHFQYKWQK